LAELKLIFPKKFPENVGALANRHPRICDTWKAKKGAPDGEAMAALLNSVHGDRLWLALTGPHRTPGANGSIARSRSAGCSSSSATPRAASRRWNRGKHDADLRSELGAAADVDRARAFDRHAGRRDHAAAAAADHHCKVDPHDDPFGDQPEVPS
jgi:hypothetical protein